MSATIGEIGEGVGSFLTNLMGKQTTVAETKTATPTAAASNTNTFVIVGLVIAGLIAVYFVFSKKTQTT